MAKKSKKKSIESVESDLDDTSLLGGDIEIAVKEPEIVAVIKPAKKDKILLGYHPITGEEVWK